MSLLLRRLFSTQEQVEAGTWRRINTSLLFSYETGLFFFKLLL